MRLLFTTLILCSLIGCGMSSTPPTVLPVTTGTPPTTSVPTPGTSAEAAVPASALQTIILDAGDTKEENRKPIPEFGYSVRPPAGFEPFKGVDVSSFAPPGFKPPSILNFKVEDAASASATVQLTQRTTDRSPQEEVDMVEKPQVGETKT